MAIKGNSGSGGGYGVQACREFRQDHRFCTVGGEAKKNGIFMMPLSHRKDIPPTGNLSPSTRERTGARELGVELM